MAATMQVTAGALANILGRAGADDVYKDVSYAKDSRQSQDYWNGTCVDRSKSICFSTNYKEDALNAGTFATRALQQGYRTYQFNSVGCQNKGAFNRHGFKLEATPEWWYQWSAAADECLQGGRHYLIVWKTDSYSGRIKQDKWKGKGPQGCVEKCTDKTLANGASNPDFGKDCVYLNACRLEWDYANHLKNMGGNVKIFTSFQQGHDFMSEAPSAGELIADGGAAIAGAVMAPANFVGNVGKNLGFW